jgi:hypothetical protein
VQGEAQRSALQCIALVQASGERGNLAFLQAAGWHPKTLGRQGGLPHPESIPFPRFTAEQEPSAQTPGGACMHACGIDSRAANTSCCTAVGRKRALLLPRLGRTRTDVRTDARPGARVGRSLFDLPSASRDALGYLERGTV